MLSAEGLLLLMDEFGWQKVFMISAEGIDYGEFASVIRDVSICDKMVPVTHIQVELFQEET